MKFNTQKDMPYISKNKSSFGLVSKEYKKYRGSYNTELYRLLFSHIKNKSTEPVSILDLGCGVGNSTEPILKMAKKLNIKVLVSGCDPDILMLKEAKASAKKNKLPITYIQGSAEKLPFENKQFDIIVSGAAFHWFATKKAMKKIQRIMKDGGFYFVFWTQNVKSKEPAIGQDLYKKYKWQGIPKELRDPKNVKELFTKAGFSKVTTAKIPYTETKTIAETIGLIKTNSTYALLSQQDRKIFIQEMTKAYAKALGKRKNILKQEIHICCGIKPE